jgi:superfamily II DNA or RNA helicase
MNDENGKFVLVGHDCPLGGYPSVVVPVGRWGGRLVVSYFSRQGTELVTVPNEARYVEHSARTALGLAQFDHTRNGLFAFDEQSVVTYILGQEREFFASLLRSNEAAALEPFYRFCLAEEAWLPDLIVKAFEECVRQLRSDSPEFAEEWIKKNRIDVHENRPSLIEQEIASWTSTTAKIPSVFFQRGQPYPFAMLRQQDELGFTEYDIVAPPRRFFSGVDPIPAAVEIGVDGRRLRPIVSPSELLIGKPPEGDSWPAHTRRTLARLFAWFLVCEDPQRRLEAREVETLAHQASLVRHVLDSPALMRVLIADEVGLGKTIEAGLIVAELLEKQPALRVLYLSPARLVSNVHKEFTRLGLYFRRWTAGGEADANLQDERIIASIHKAAYEANAERVVGAPSWDVLIVDECHHLSSYGSDARKPVRQYSLVQKLIEKRPEGRVLLMSGTPNQGNPDRFNNLLRLLRAPGESDAALEGRVIYRTKEDVLGWQNEPLFPLREVNPPKIIPLIPDYEQWLEEIYHFYVPDEAVSWESSKSAKRRAAGWRCAQALQWAASSVEAGLGYLVRQAIRLNWDLSHAELREAIAAIRPYRLGKPDEQVSALFDRIVKEVTRQRLSEDIDDIDDPEDENDWSANQEQLGTLLEHGVQLHARVADSKWGFIWNEILSKASGDQFVLFAQPIETVTALSNYLLRKTGRKPALIVGGQTDADREAEVKRFWAGEAQFMVSSRAGSEGINLQCAHRLVHVDVPWNPMEMEQRVGRVHRFGSQMTIVVDTVVLERTREERAYAVAYEKLRNIARSLTKGQERFEELFSRVMSLIPPAELQDIMAQAAVGPLSADDSNRIATLVEAGYKNWRSFHEKFHAEHKLRVPDPGLASWDDLERFIRQYVKGKPVSGFSTLRFERRNRKQIESVLDEIPVFQLPDGSLVCCADVGGRQILGPLAGSVRPAGLNTPLIATALRNAAFSEEPSGVAHIRWADQTPKPVGVPDGTVGMVGIARVAVRREGGAGWVENRNELHLWMVPKNEAPSEILGERLGAVVRGILAASVRAKVDLDLELTAQMSAVEARLVDRYRVRTETDIDAGIRYAVFPLCAIVVSE